MKTVNLNELSDSELQAELKRRKEKTLEDREALKKMIGEFVPGITKNLIVVSKDLSQVKADVFGAFKDILALKADIYNVKADQQTHTFSSESHSITIGYRMIDKWDDTWHEGVAKVNEFIQSLAKDENSATLVKALTMMLKPDRQGNLKASRVLDMQKLAESNQNPLLVDGVAIIAAAHKPERSNWFIEASYKDENGKDQNIPLSISSCDWPEGFDFNFLTQNS